MATATPSPSPDPSATATDAGGVASVTIQAGKGKPKAVRSLKVRMPRRKGAKVKITVVIIDTAGNSVRLTKTLKSK